MELAVFPVKSCRLPTASAPRGLSRALDHIRCTLRTYHKAVPSVPQPNPVLWTISGSHATWELLILVLYYLHLILYFGSLSDQRQMFCTFFSFHVFLVALTPAYPVLSQVINCFYICLTTTINYSDVCKDCLGAQTILELACTPPCTEKDINWQLCQCRPGKAPGPDGIQAPMLKVWAMELS